VLDALEQALHDRRPTRRGRLIHHSVRGVQYVSINTPSACRRLASSRPWVDWFNHRRLLEPIGNIPPAEAEERYYAILKSPAMAA
jgi:putative transposase